MSFELKMELTAFCSCVIVARKPRALRHMAIEKANGYTACLSDSLNLGRIHQSHISTPHRYVSIDEENIVNLEKSVRKDKNSPPPPLSNTHT